MGGLKGPPFAEKKIIAPKCLYALIRNFLTLTKYQNQRIKSLFKVHPCLLPPWPPEKEGNLKSGHSILIPVHDCFYSIKIRFA